MTTIRKYIEGMKFSKAWNKASALAAKEFGINGYVKSFRQTQERQGGLLGIGGIPEKYEVEIGNWEDTDIEELITLATSVSSGADATGADAAFEAQRRLIAYGSLSVEPLIKHIRNDNIRFGHRHLLSRLLKRIDASSDEKVNALKEKALQEFISVKNENILRVTIYCPDHVDSPLVKEYYRSGNVGALALSSLTEFHQYYKNKGVEDRVMEICGINLIDVITESVDIKWEIVNNIPEFKIQLLKEFVPDEKNRLLDFTWHTEEYDVDMLIKLFIPVETEDDFGDVK